MLLRFLLKHEHLFLATAEDSHFFIVDMKPHAVAITNIKQRRITVRK
jgi:hypothetical protein